MQPIYVQKIAIIGHFGWLAIEEADIFHQDVSGFSSTVIKEKILGMSDG